MDIYTITRTTSLHILGDMKRRIKESAINYYVRIVKNALIEKCLDLLLKMYSNARDRCIAVTMCLRKINIFPFQKC